LPPISWIISSSFYFIFLYLVTCGKENIKQNREARASFMRYLYFLRKDDQCQSIRASQRFTQYTGRHRQLDKYHHHCSSYMSGGMCKHDENPYKPPCFQVLIESLAQSLIPRSLLSGTLHTICIRNFSIQQNGRMNADRHQLCHSGMRRRDGQV
jgi:hypothetical protein